MRTSAILITAASALLAQAASVADNKPTSLPVVDLKYVQQRASGYDSEVGYYNFSNIAFAQPPVGDLRFTAPQPPKKINGIQDGNGKRRVCPQAYPKWLATFVAGQNIPLNPTDDEDCLYLDVFAPKAIFDKRRSQKSPVVVFIYGGGFVIGSKIDNNPRGFLRESINGTNSDGVIYVSANYRVGNFGILGGSDLEAQGGTSNAGLLDQRLALDWVRKNIHLFGGDADQVTVMGESGGASSIAHQISGARGLGGHKPLPFQQVILQSPGEAKANTISQGNEQYQTFLKQLNVTTLTEARKLDTATLQKANFDLIQQFPAGNFPYTFTVDNKVVFETARKALLEDQCAVGDLKAIIAYNLNEGAIFTPQTNITFDAYLAQWLPGLSSQQYDTISNKLYPASTFPSNTARINTFVGDLLIDCNAAAYHKAFNHEAYAYKFGMPTPGNTRLPPGYHIQDLKYTFFDKPSPIVITDVALDMQTKFVNFAVHGDPNAAGKGLSMPVYGAKHEMLSYTGNGTSIIVDSEAIDTNARCQFWANL